MIKFADLKRVFTRFHDRFKSTLIVCIALCTVFAAPLGFSACVSGDLTQPTSGYGANGRFAQGEVSFTNPARADDLVYVYFPEGAGPAPTVFFAHAWGARPPEVYTGTIRHLNSIGFTVVYAQYPTLRVSMTERYKSLWEGFRAAAERYPHYIDTRQVAFFGHSFGGGAVPRMALNGTALGWGEQGLALYAMAPWYAKEVTDDDLATFPDHTRLLMLVLADDDVNDHRMAIDTYHSITLPPESKAYYLLHGDSEGDCELVADHAMPLEGGRNGETDGLDFWNWYHMDALLDAAFYESTNGQHIALGQGNAEQRYFGTWRSGRDYRALDILTDPAPPQPESFYQFPCNDPENGRAMYCERRLAAEPVTADEARKIARDALIFAYPMMQNYQTINARLRGTDPRAPNQLIHRTRLMDHTFTDIVAPNNDTLYSSAVLDLRAEPVVFSLPPVPENRYYSIQLVDMFTHNLGYIGGRTTGNSGGNFLVIGPRNPQVDTSGFDGVFRSESDFIFAIGRMLATDSNDEPAAIALMQQYELQTLSAFTSSEPAPAPEAVLYPVWDPQAARTQEFIGLFNFLLGFIDIPSHESTTFARFSRIGIAPNLSWNSERYSAEILDAIAQGVLEGYAAIEAEGELIGSQVNGWNTTYEGFGPRQMMEDKPLLRAAAAMIGLYGNDREENSSYSRSLDIDGQPMDTSRYNYRLHFSQADIPPTNGFWSLTLYRLPERLLLENPIDRYSIGDRTDGLQLATDGSLTLYIQNEQPADTSNWLPAPNGPFVLALRNYLPDPAVYTGQWSPPQLLREARE